MRSRTYLLPTLLLAAAVHADTYDWAYSSSGDPRVTPIQVFDNGKRTYFQFHQMDPPPAFFAVTPAGQALLQSRREGQFFVIDRVERQVAITLGNARAAVRYGAKGREDKPAMFGAAPTPVPAAQILASRRPPGTDAKASTATADAAQSWIVRIEDRTISGALARWAREAGWNFSWEAPRDFPASISATFNMPFEEAVVDVVMSYSTSDAPIKATFARFGTNKVLRIVKYQGNSHD